MNELWPIVRVLLLLAAANSTPMFATKLLKDHFNAPLDGGVTFFDGRPLFGASKTVRGIAISLICTALAAVALGFDWVVGVQVAVLSMLGDLISSFIKRRLGRPLHSAAFGLDQIPESLLPLLILRATLGLMFVDIVLIVALFVVFELVLSKLLFELHIRDQPS